MAVNLSPIGGVAGQFFDNNGNPLVGGQLYTYAAGTTTPQVTFTSALGNTPNSNPIILNGGGRVPAEIWLTDGLEYKFVLYSSTDQLIGSWDNITGINSNFVNFTTAEEIQTSTAGQTVFTLTTMQYAPNTNNLVVYVDGVNQIEGGAYSFVETDATTVTFVAGLHEGALVKFVSAEVLSTGVSNAANVIYDPAGTGAVSTNVQTKLRETVSVKDFGAVGDGVADDTAAIQAAIDAAFIKPASVLFPSGTYAVTGIKAYGIFADNGAGTILSGAASHLKFEPNAVLKMTSSSGFVIRTAQSPTQLLPQDELLYGVIENPVIDMDSKGDVGILLECVHYWKVTSPDIRNVPAGTFTYDDGNTTAAPGARIYPKSGIIIKGTTGVAGSYNNIVTQPFIRGVSDSVRGECGIWMSATGTENNQRANFNELHQGSYTWLKTGIDIEQGFNQKINMPNVFSCDDGIRINTGRNAIIKPYLELCNRGLYITGNAGFNSVYNLSSVATSTTGVANDGIDTSMFPENYFPRYGALSTGGGGTSGQSIPSGVWTKVLLDAISLQQTKIASITDIANNRFQIDAEGDGEGLYLILGTFRIPSPEDQKRYELAVYKNGSISYPYSSVAASGTNTINLQVTSYAVLEKNDYIELWFRHNATADVIAQDSIQNQLFVVKQMYDLNKPINR